MEFIISPDVEQLVWERVASGQYPSPDEVIREALQLLEDRDRLRGLRLEDLRKEVALGLQDAEEGRVAELDMDAIRRKVAERLGAQAGGSSS